jgi:hypothetical protein
MATAVRTRFPCGPNTGTLADRYPTYDDIPYLSRVGSNAIQCGAAGYWYVDADLSARLRDDVDVATGEAIQVLDTASSAITGGASTAVKWGIAAAALYLIGQFIGRRR